jgi:hypothetical protein
VTFDPFPDRPECAFCGERDPMWNFVPSRNWGTYDGLTRCADCAWMGVTVPRDEKAA